MFALIINWVPDYFHKWPGNVNHGYMKTLTWNTSIGDPQEFFISARIAEDRDVHLERTVTLSGAGAVQRKVDVDVAVPGVWNVTARRDSRVVSSVANRLEHQHLALVLARDLELVVEACERLNDRCNVEKINVNKHNINVRALFKDNPKCQHFPIGKHLLTSSSSMTPGERQSETMLDSSSDNTIMLCNLILYNVT